MLQQPSPGFTRNALHFVAFLCVFSCNKSSIRHTIAKYDRQTQEVDNALFVIIKHEIWRLNFCNNTIFQLKSITVATMSIGGWWVEWSIMWTREMATGFAGWQTVVETNRQPPPLLLLLLHRDPPLIATPPPPPLNHHRCSHCLRLAPSQRCTQCTRLTAASHFTFYIAHFTLHILHRTNPHKSAQIRTNLRGVFSFTALQLLLTRMTRMAHHTVSGSSAWCVLYWLELQWTATQCPARVGFGQSKSEKWRKNDIHSFREVQVKKMTWDRDREMKVK